MSRSAACLNKPDTRCNRLGSRPAFGGVVLICALCVMAQAQEANTPPEFQLDVSQRLEWSDNAFFGFTPTDELQARTDLDFTWHRATGVDLFELGLGGALIYSTADVRPTGFQDPFFDLTLRRDVRHARAGVTYSYSEDQLDGLTVTDPLVEDNFIVVDGGSRISERFAIDGAVGVGGPLGAEFSLSRASQEFSGTTDADLRDQETDSFFGQVNLQINPVIEGRLFLRYTDRDEQGAAAIDRETRIFGTGLTYAITESLTADFTISHDRIEQTSVTNPVVDGLSYALNLVQERPNGAVVLDLSSRVTENDRRDLVQLRRTLDLKRGSLAFSGGLSRTAGFSTRVLFGLDYVAELPRGRFSVSLSQTPATGSNNEERINTNFEMGYTQDLDSVSRISANLGLRQTNELGAFAVDEERLDIGLTYRRDLAQDWDLIGSYSYIRASDDANPDRTQNKIFVGIEKTFAWQ